MTQIQKWDGNIDTVTGEVMEGDITPFQSPLLQALMSNQTPVYLQALIAKYPDDPEKVEEEYSQFAGVNPVNLKDKLENGGPFEADVLGMTLLPHDEYVGMDGNTHEGYWRIFILTTDKDSNGQHVVYTSSGGSLMQHAILAIKSRGWYMWKQPVRYRFSSGKKGAHFMNRVDRPNSTNRPAK